MVLKCENVMLSLSKHGRVVVGGVPILRQAQDDIFAAHVVVGVVAGCDNAARVAGGSVGVRG